MLGVWCRGKVYKDVFFIIILILTLLCSFFFSCFILLFDFILVEGLIVINIFWVCMYRRVSDFLEVVIYLEGFFKIGFRSFWYDVGYLGFGKLIYFVGLN